MLLAALVMCLYMVNVQAATAVARAVAGGATIAPEPPEPGVCSNRMPEKPEFLAGSIPDMALYMQEVFRGHPNYEHGKDHFVKFLMDHFSHINTDLPGKCNGFQECEVSQTLHVEAKACILIVSRLFGPAMT